MPRKRAESDLFGGKYKGSLETLFEQGWRLSPGGTRLYYAPHVPGTHLPRKRRKKRKASQKPRPTLFSSETEDDD